MEDSPDERNEASERENALFARRLEALHEISLELSGLPDVDEICRRAIELGRERLGVDRMGIWFIDEGEPGYITGSFGVDESGHLRDERGVRHRIGTSGFLSSFLKDKKAFVHQENAPVRDQFKHDVGVGIKDSIAMWEGDLCLGYISFDNLLTMRVDTGHDLDIKVLFSKVIGNCVAMKRSETNLKAALDEKRRLLRELNHRVKNNMQVVLSFLNLEREDDRDADYLLHLRSMETRISALLCLQSSFHETNRADGAEIAAAVDYLFRTVRSAFLDDPRLLALKASLGLPVMGVEPALGLGLLFNEFFVLCAKRSRASEAPQTISIAVAVGPDTGESFARLSSTLPVFEAESRAVEASVSLKILGALALQIGGGLEIDSGNTSARIGLRLE